MIENPQIVSGKLLNLDEHPSLLEDRSIIFGKNLDIQGKEGTNSWFVQNQLSNELCFEFPENYHLNGPGIRMNNFDYAVFFVVKNDLGEYVSSEIGIWNSNSCSYTAYVNDPCLNFNLITQLEESINTLITVTKELFIL